VGYLVSGHLVINAALVLVTNVDAISIANIVELPSKRAVFTKPVSTQTAPASTPLGCRVRVSVRDGYSFREVRHKTHPNAIL